MGIIVREGRIVPEVFMSLSAQNATFFYLSHPKTGTFFDIKKLKYLYVKASILNQ